MMDCLAHAFARHGDIVEWQNPHGFARADDLALLVALAGDQHNILATGHPQRGGDGLPPVADFMHGGAARAHPRQHGGADGGGVFTARIVVGDDGDVGLACGDAAHFRALAGIAVAAGAEYHDQPAANMRTQRCYRGGQRIGRVGVIDIDGRARAGERRPLQPPAYRLQAR